MPGALVNSEDTSTDTHHDFSPSTWVRLFRPHTARTRFVTLPGDFTTRELSGAVYIAEPVETGGAPAAATEIEWSDGSVDTIAAPSVRNEADTVRAIHAEIQQAISTLGGAVCPKFGTKCPVDATWAAFQRSTKCATPDDMLTLLKSSERVMSDVKAGDSIVVALRQWADLDDRAEFRVFVRDRAMVGMCPRLMECIVEYTQEEIDAIVDRVLTWYDCVVRDRYDGPASYVLDVYKDRHDRVWIIDFAPWGGCTDALLFTWEQLEESTWMSTQGRAQFRYAYRHAAVRPSPRMYDGLPVELRGAEAITSLAEAAQRLMQGQDDDDDGDDE